MQSSGKSHRPVIRRNKKSGILARVAAAMCVPLGARVVHANTTYYFVGTNDLWNTASNWSPAVVPVTSSADAYLGNSANTTSVDLNAVYSSPLALNSLTINSNAVIDITLFQNTAGTVMWANNESIGTTVALNYYNQSAGTNNVNNLLAFGTQNYGEGAYYLSGTGVLNAAAEQIGNSPYGTGAFYQSGGTNTVTNLIVGNLTQAGLSNSYTMTGGTLNVSAGNLTLGSTANSSFNQTGGTVYIDNFVNISGTNSTYTLSGNGSVQCGSPGADLGLTVGGSQANDNFVQTGGTVDLGDFSVLAIGSINGSASYTLSATTGTGSLAVDFEYVGGETGTGYFGTFNQSGGSNSINAGLYIGQNYSTPPSPSTISTGLYNITGGTLNAGAINPTEIISGAINQSGGTAIFPQLFVGDTQYSNGVYTLTGGNFNVGSGSYVIANYSLLVGVILPSPNFGYFNQTGGSAVVGGLTLGDSGLGFFSLSGTGIFNCSGPAQIGLTDNSAQPNNADLNFHPSLATALGVYLQSGGSSIFSGGVVVGDAQSGNSATGQMTLTGGTMNLSTSSLTLGSAASGLVGSGTLNQSGGTLTTSAVQLGNGSTGTGTYQLNGGILVTSSIYKGTGTASFDFNGGTLLAGSATSGLFSNFSPTINTGGGAINTNGSNVTITSGLIHNPGLAASTVDGGLTVTGDGTLILKGPGTYNGRTTIDSGLLVAYFNLSSASIGYGPVTLNGGEAILHRLSAATAFYILQLGYSGGAWTGSVGINSITAANDKTHLTAVGMLVPTSSTTFYDQPLGPSDVGIKYAYYGDANLDGKVTSADYTAIDNGYLSHLTGWYNGDFNYDGTVNGSDYTLIDNAFNMQGATISSEIASPTAELDDASVSTVPEPATVSVLALGGGLVLGRRRRPL